MESSPVFYTSMPCPLGVLWVARTARGLVATDFATDELAFHCRLESFGLPSHSPQQMRHETQSLTEYFEGSRTSFEIPLELAHLKPFQQLVLRAVTRVPYGSVQTYGGIAREVGRPAAARAVGTAVATNPVSIVIPCHRIVPSSGQVGQYALRSMGREGVRYKRWLLNLEGAGGAVRDRSRGPRVAGYPRPPTSLER